MRAYGPFSCTPPGSVWGFRGRQGQAARWPTASLDPLSTPTRSTGFCGPGRAGEGDCWGRAAGRSVATAGSRGRVGEANLKCALRPLRASGTPTAQSGFARERALEREARNGRQRSGALDGGLGQDRPEAGALRAYAAALPGKRENPAGAGFWSIRTGPGPASQRNLRQPLRPRPRQAAAGVEASAHPAPAAPRDRAARDRRRPRPSRPFPGESASQQPPLRIAPELEAHGRDLPPRLDRPPVDQPAVLAAQFLHRGSMIRRFTWPKSDRLGGASMAVVKSSMVYSAQPVPSKRVSSSRSFQLYVERRALACCSW